jgi:DNA-binding NarL/FixJ family response regulator
MGVVDRAIVTAPPMSIVPSTESSASFAEAGDFSSENLHALRPRADSSSAASGRRPAECVTLLLAEERTMVRQGIDALLRPAPGIAVVGHAADSGQMFELAAKLRPDCVIVAVRMALRLGLETVRGVLQSRCGSSLLVLLPRRDCPLIGHVSVAGAAGYVTEEDSAERVAHAIRGLRRAGDDARVPAGCCAPPRFSSAPGGREITRLTARECEALQLIAEGNANKQIAGKLRISIKTVEKHRQNLMDKLGIHETATLTRYALLTGIVP